MRTIVLTGGGTAGHCIPHVAILDYLKNDFDRICYIGSENGIERRIIENYGIPYYYIECTKLVRGFTPKNLLIPFKLMAGIKQAKKILKKLEPDVVFSKGGYVALPVVMAASKLNIPVIAHESDLTAGLANKISAKYCKEVLTSFPETANEFKTGRYVGPPIRKTLFKGEKSYALKRFGFSGEKPVVLVLGGSSGSVAINETIKNALDELLVKFDVLHITGKGNSDEANDKKGYRQKEYVDDMENAFAVCDVAVSRAGSNSVFELLSLKIPSVLIPLPKGNSRGDQVLNADYFEKKGLITLLEQKNLTPASLVTAINGCYANRYNLKSNMDKAYIKESGMEISRILADTTIR